MGETCEGERVRGTDLRGRECRGGKETTREREEEECAEE